MRSLNELGAHVAFALVVVLSFNVLTDTFPLLDDFVPTIYWGMAFYCAVYHISLLLSPYVFPKVFESLGVLQQHLWCMRIMSTVHALITGIGGVIAVQQPHAMDDPCTSWVDFIGHVGAHFLGYTLYDTLLTAMHFKARGKPYDIMIHHLLIGSMAFMPLVTRQYAMVVACYLGNELSTPFLNLMHFMKDANIPKDAPIVKANQIAFAIVFFFARVVVDLYVICALIVSGAIQTQATIRVWLGGAGVIGFAILQCYWFLFIVKMAMGNVKEKPAVDAKTE